jgi:uncharacterized membrane protein
MFKASIMPAAIALKGRPMDTPLELIVSVYNDRLMAGTVLSQLKKMDDDGSLDIRNAAMLIKDEDGHLHLKDEEDVGTGAGALFGAITGGLIGLLGGPAGAIVGAVAGAATGGAAAAIIDMGFSNDQLKELQASMPAGSSALVVLVEHKWIEKLVGELEKNRGKLFRHELNPSTISMYENDLSM